MDKRTFIKSVFLGSTGLIITSRANKLKASVNRKKWDGKFILPELGFAYNALEPHLDARALQFHHVSEHAAYTDRFNAVVKEAGLTGKTAFEILSDASKYSETIRNSGGGYLNHKLFWKMLSPARGQKPSNQLMNAFDRDFGSFDAFREKFTRSANAVPSEGWAWLIYSNNRLTVTHTTGNNSPVMDTESERGKPLLCLDLWQHAYAETFQDDRSAYVESFWNVVNWDFVSKRYARITTPTG